jgi:hypothetical protein
LKWEQEHLDNNRYTLDMVKIDDKIKRVITDIKLEEARIAHLQNNVEGSAPQVSVATYNICTIHKLIFCMDAV